ncbi:MAG: Hpt domain-containing protein [Deltaproteobacteria bacterium]|nr:Hpt domain-containing protein [Deltaproteobacteria bacterium]
MSTFYGATNFFKSITWGLCMDLKALAENLGLEEEEYVEMLDLFFESGGSDLKQLDAAIKEGSVEKAHVASHSFKGSSGSLGLDNLFKLATIIDDKARQGVLDGLEGTMQQLLREYDELVQAVSK